MRPCSQCSAPISADAKLCEACGANASAGANTAEPAICSGCGVLVDASRSSCATCNAPYADPPLRAASQPSAGYWVAVRATFTCNACRFDVPLNHFELGAGVVCTRCGLEQRYDASSWRELVDLAHAVGDLGAPGPEGRFPDSEVRLAQPKPFADLGVTTSFTGDRKHRASPGNPLCVACKAPRVVVAKRDREIDVACARCSTKSTYAIPPQVHVERLAGVLADEHEQGREEATITDESGVVVLRCPSCSAPLKGVKDADGVVTCAYCQVPCRISSRTHARAGHKETPVKTWWLYFDKPSARRRKLLNEAREEAARERKRREREAQRERSRASERNEIARAARASDEAFARGRSGHSTADRRAKAAERKALVPLFAMVVAAPIIGGVIWYQSREKADATKIDVAPRPGDDDLLRYSFAMSSADVRALFGADAKPGAKIKLREGGVFTEVELGGVGGPTYSLALSGGAKLDVTRMIDRLAKIAPNRLEKDAATQREINVARTLLRVDPRPSTGFKARIHVMTWVAGERGVKAADAFLATVRYAALDAPQPTAEQLRLLNGAPLADAAPFDVTTPVEDAATRFAGQFEMGECVTQTDLLTKRTELTCSTDVDAAVISQARFAWPSDAKARLRQVTFVRSKQSATAPDPAACLETALGRGDEKVVDFASGRKVRSWPLGKRGDRVVVDSATIEVVAREGAKTDELADWTQTYPKIVDALARCRSLRP